jgi:hypothetical protein
MGNPGLNVGRTRAGYRGIYPGTRFALRDARGFLEPLGSAVEMAGALTGNVDDHARAVRRRAANAGIGPWPLGNHLGRVRFDYQRGLLRAGRLGARQDEQAGG